jgi:hypothetical protein
VIPDVILDGLAARPDDPAVWQVLTDFLLENDAREAPLARLELDLMRGFSDPDRIGEFAAARGLRSMLPGEPWRSYSALWRCGFAVKLTLDLGWPAADLRAAASSRGVQGLHALTLTQRNPHPEAVVPEEAPLAARLRDLQPVIPRFLRRLSLRLEGLTLARREVEQSEVLLAVLDLLPPSVAQLDVALGRLEPASYAAVLALAQRVKALVLDGTVLDPRYAPLVSDWLATGCEVFLGGTRLDSRLPEFAAAQWVPPTCRAWLVDEEEGTVTPITEADNRSVFEVISNPLVARWLRRDLGGWTWAERPLDDGDVVALGDDTPLRFRLR